MFDPDPVPADDVPAVETIPTEDIGVESPTPEDCVSDSRTDTEEMPTERSVGAIEDTSVDPCPILHLATGRHIYPPGSEPR